MIPARLFRSPAFSAGRAAIFAINTSLTGVIFLMPQFQQVVAGQDPLGAGLRLLPWGIAPFLIGPRAGALADRTGERALVVSGSLLQAGGLAWIAVAAGPGSGYPALIAPMTIIGVGFALAIPAVTRSVTSSVPPADIGRASGAFTTMRQLGGAFGVAVLGAAFAATGSYATPAFFSHGFVTAFGVAAGITLAGTAAGTILPTRGTASHRPPHRPRLAGRSAPPRRLPYGVLHRRTRTFADDTLATVAKPAGAKPAGRPSPRQRRPWPFCLRAYARSCSRRGTDQPGTSAAVALRSATFRDSGLIK